MKKVNLAYNLWECGLIKDYEEWKRIYRPFYFISQMKKVNSNVE